MRDAAARSGTLRPDRCDIAFALGLALGVVAVFLFGMNEYRGRILETSDFSGFWAGPRAIVIGIDPYDPSRWIETAAALRTKPPDTIVYAYPPWVALALLPFGLLPLAIATDVWIGLGFIAAVVALRALLRAAVRDLPLVHWIAGATLLLSQAGLATYFNGQWTYLLLATSVGVYLLHRTHPRIAAIFALSALAKPQLFAFTLWSWLRAAYARARDLRFAATVAAGVAAAVAVTLLVDPRWLARWVTSALLVRVTDPTTPTLTAALADIAGPLAPFAAVVVLLLALFVALRFDPAGAAWWAVWPVVSLLSATYTRSYDQLLLVPPLVISTGIVAARSRRAAVRYAALWGLLLLPGSLLLQGIAAFRDRENFTILLTAAVFVLIALVHRAPTRSALSDRR